MKKKELIIVYDYFTPAYKAGGPVQSLVNMVRELGNSLYAKVLCSNKDLDNGILDVTANTWMKLNDLPASVYYNAHDFAALNTALDDNPDRVFFINGLYSVTYNFLPVLKLKGRKIVSARGMLHPGGLSQKSLKKKLYLGLWKLLRLHHKCEFHATTPQEAEHIRSVFGTDIKAWVVPNFPRVLQPVLASKPLDGVLKLCTVALISPMKNHLLVLEALKKITSPVQYDIYGPVKDEGYWEECKTLIKNLPAHIQVNYHEDIKPADVQAALNQAHVYIQPSKSENFGHSLFEAMTAGKPIITSEYTPWNGLRKEQAGANVQIRDIDSIAAAISFFAAMGEEEYGNWCRNTREYALRSTDTENIRRQYFEMFDVS